MPTDYSSGGFYRYCPATLVEGGVRHVFYCKNTTANQIVDSIYHATVDAAGNLSGESAVLDPADSTGTAWDSYHVCDPSVIKGAFVYNGHTYTYLMAYLGVQGRVGDTANVAELKPTRPPDLWIHHCLCKRHVTGAGAAHLKPKLAVVAHLHEMCHPSGGSRWTFADGDAAKGESEKAGVPAVVPFWGERIA